MNVKIANITTDSSYVNKMSNVFCCSMVTMKLTLSNNKSRAYHQYQILERSRHDHFN